MIAEIAETLGLSGLAIVALTYIARQIVLHVFSRDLVAHNARLEHQT